MRRFSGRVLDEDEDIHLDLATPEAYLCIYIYAAERCRRGEIEKGPQAPVTEVPSINHKT